MLAKPASVKINYVDIYTADLPGYIFDLSDVQILMHVTYSCIEKMRLYLSNSFYKEFYIIIINANGSSFMHITHI